MGRKDYQIDRQHDAHIARVVLTSGGAGFIWGLVGYGTLTGALFLAAILSVIGLAIYYAVAVGSAKLISGAILPDTRGRAGVGYSHIEALEAKGDIAGALAAWESAIANDPLAVAARMQAADLYAHTGTDASRAAALFREIQTHPRAEAEVQRYASQRLIDLYLGVLNDDGRALVEMRKLIDRWPDTREAEHARTAIANIKAQRHDRGG